MMRNKNCVNTRIHTNCANKNLHAGFTLIELLVSVAIFSSMIAVVSSIFVSAVSSQRKNIGQQDVLDNARYVLENIGRSIRQSSIISQRGSNGPSLIIQHPTEGQITYDLQNNKIMEKIGFGNPIALSSNNVYVSRLNFKVSENNPANNIKIQPRVTISISLRNSSSKTNEQSDIDLQTTITPRILQYE